MKHFAGVPGFPKGGVVDVFLPGILSLLAFASGSSMGFSTIFELQAGVIERFRVTPASRFAILIGPILSGLMMMMVFDSVVVFWPFCSACSQASRPRSRLRRRW